MMLPVPCSMTTPHGSCLVARVILYSMMDPIAMTSISISMKFKACTAYSYRFVLSSLSLILLLVRRAHYAWEWFRFFQNQQHAVL
jgi:hypothetical protein